MEQKPLDTNDMLASSNGACDSVPTVSLPSMTAEILKYTVADENRSPAPKPMDTGHKKATPAKSSVKTRVKTPRARRTPRSSSAKKISADKLSKKPSMKHIFSASKTLKHVRTSKKTANITRFVSEDYPWHCWQCFRAFSDENDFSKHIKSCSVKRISSFNTDNVSSSTVPSLPGCPFCPRDGFQSDLKPFFFTDFNSHVRDVHNKVKQLSCPYCLGKTSRRLQDLVSHIVLEHRVHWRPTPASLVYLRTDDVVHRVVTCLGCGWCTFVLRASDAVQPPTSLSSHLSRCASHGGQIHLVCLPPGINAENPSRQTVARLTEAAYAVSETFGQRFPGVRGFTDLTAKRPPPLALKYESPLRNKHVIPKVRVNEGKVIESTATASVTVEEVESPPPQPPVEPPPAVQDAEVAENLVPVEDQVTVTVKPTSKKEPAPPPPPAGSSNFVPKGIFDVPLDLPPPPPPQLMRPAKKVVSRVYVCPICGDNALASLRERDEHLQSEHHGELVFPCQLCGMAYPLYIALRRHAVLKHSSNFDAVLYGKPDAEPVDCPYCELVAFTRPEVLRLHLSKIHPDQVQQQAVVAAVASSLGPEEDDLKDKDWTGNSKSTERKTKETTSRRGNHHHSTKSGEAFSEIDLLDDPDLLESVESPFGFSDVSRRGSGARGVSGRGIGGFRGRRRGGRRSHGRARGGKASGGMAAAVAPTFLSQRPLLVGRPQAPGAVDASAVQSDNLAAAGGEKLEMAGTGSLGPSLVLTTVAMDPLEALLLHASGALAPATCRLCGPQNQVMLDNEKEVCIHLELDHNLSSACEQLGCQACGRIFFGPNHRQDLIGHFRISHQGQEMALKCPNHEPVHITTSEQDEESDAAAGDDDDPTALMTITGGGCPAKFTSARLRESHLAADPTLQPGWACPLQLEAELLQAMSSPVQMADGFDPIVLATEIAADAAGQMILAYGCPNCSRVFTGENCTARYLTHRSHCDAMAAAATGVVEEQHFAVVTTTDACGGGGTMEVVEPAVLSTTPEPMQQ
uniref:C2H2-type zinc finger n=2 Tax=Schistocephalus solidus TaxID=70667 RepID=A0A0X3PQ09_SCHSO